MLELQSVLHAQQATIVMEEQQCLSFVPVEDIPSLASLIQPANHAYKVLNAQLDQHPLHQSLEDVHQELIVRTPMREHCVLLELMVLLLVSSLCRQHAEHALQDIFVPPVQRTLTSPSFVQEVIIALLEQHSPQSFLAQLELTIQTEVRFLLEHVEFAQVVTIVIEALLITLNFLASEVGSVQKEVRHLEMLKALRGALVVHFTHLMGQRMQPIVSHARLVIIVEVISVVMGRGLTRSIVTTARFNVLQALTTLFLVHQIL